MMKDLIKNKYKPYHKASRLSKLLKAGKTILGMQSP